MVSMTWYLFMLELTSCSSTQHIQNIFTCHKLWVSKLQSWVLPHRFQPPLNADVLKVWCMRLCGAVYCGSVAYGYTWCACYLCLKYLSCEMCSSSFLSSVFYVVIQSVGVKQWLCSICNFLNGYCCNTQDTEVFAVACTSVGISFYYISRKS